MEPPSTLPHGGPDRMTVTAIFTLAAMHERARFTAREGREPSEEEMELMRRRLFDEWARTSAHFGRWLQET